MNDMEQKKNDTSNRELLLIRTLNAPIELIWEVWSNPARIAQWWGPNGFTTTITTMDLQPGGQWNLVMHGPDGTDYDNRSVFKEVVPHEKLCMNTSPTHISWLPLPSRPRVNRPY